MGSLHVSIMWLQYLLPLLALYSDCHGALLPKTRDRDLVTIVDTLQDFLTDQFPSMKQFNDRVKRHSETEDQTGFIVFPFPVLGATFKIKLEDPSDYRKGGEAYLHIDDLQSHISVAHSKMVKLHIKFDSEASLVNVEVNYQLEHKDGSGIEAGSLIITMEDRGDKLYHTNIKTETRPFTGIPVIPSKVSNMELNIALKIETEIIRWFSTEYIGNIQANLTNEGATSTMEASYDIGILFFIIPLPIEININADHAGTKYSGILENNMKSVHNPQEEKNWKVEIMKGDESILQFIFKFKYTGPRSTSFQINYTYKNESSTILGQFSDNGMLTIKAGTYKIVLGPYQHSIEIIVTKGDKELLSYTIGLRDTSTLDSDTIIFEVFSELTLDSEFILYGLIQKYHPFGAFLTRTMTVKITKNRRDRNLFLPIKIEFNIIKDDVLVLDMVADTMTSPYNFTICARNLFRLMNIHQEAITMTVDYMRGSHFIIDANVGGGFHLEARQAYNSLGGRAINILISEADVEVFTYHADTSKVDTVSLLKFGFKGDMMLNPESILYRTVFTKYQFLTPFRTRSSDLEFMVDRVHKNDFLNKFHIKSKVDKDGVNVLNLEISTNHKPFKFYFFYPVLFEKLRPGMTEVNVSIDHVLGQHLYLDVHHAGARWKGFKISKTGNGNNAGIEWNGRNLCSGDCITWKNKWDTMAFFLDNAVSINLDTTEERLDLNMEWGMNKVPDMDFNTSENGHFKVTANGYNARLGDFSMNRDMTWNTGNRKLAADMKGSTTFSAGTLHYFSPMVTDIHFTYDIPAHDLEGTFKEVLAGKEYSITFPNGSFTMPTITINGFTVVTLASLG